MKKTSLYTLPVLCACLLLGSSKPVGGADGTTAELEAALATIEAVEIGSDVRFLSSDDLAGRDTPGPGLKLAARFIQARIQRLGFKPGAGEDFLQEYPLRHRAIDLSRSAFSVETSAGESLRLRFDEDYLFTNGEVWDHTIEAGLIGAGKGEREDIEGRDYSGKWALCVDSGRHAGLRRRLLMQAGAVGVIVLPNAELPDQKRREKIRRSAMWAKRGSIEFPEAELEKVTVERPAADYFHQVYLTEAGFNQLAARIGSSNVEELAIPGRQLDWTAKDERFLPGEGGVIEVENVCGFWPGSEPELARDVILISAHYDHVGTRDGKIYNGADDNASGTSGLLAIAEALATHGPLRRSVMLIWVSAEEKGLFGSQAWVESPTLPPGSRAICNINIDMIGRNEPGELYITPSENHRKFNTLGKLAAEFSPLEGFEELGDADAYYERSDHANFARMGIPVAFLFNGEHEDYHQPTDTYEKIDTDKIRRVSRLVLRMIAALQSDNLDL